MLSPVFRHAVELYSTLPDAENDFIKWAPPIPYFGDISRSKVATIGINPSNLEFVDSEGCELKGDFRRFQSLNSLCLENWEDATESQLELIENDCNFYFQRNPYDRWFKKLDFVISGTSHSYYFPSGEACHIDLVPYATLNKWSSLSYITRQLLLEKSSIIFRMMLNQSQVELVILNGQSVVSHFQKATNCDLNRSERADWDLRRLDGRDVLGYSYKGHWQSNNGREILVVGFNHNIQSSFGVTKEVQESIRQWVTLMASDL